MSSLGVKPVSAGNRALRGDSRPRVSSSSSRVRNPGDSLFILRAPSREVQLGVHRQCIPQPVFSLEDSLVRRRFVVPAVSNILGFLSLDRRGATGAERLGTLRKIAREILVISPLLLLVHLLQSRRGRGLLLAARGRGSLRERGTGRSPEPQLEYMQSELERRQTPQML